MISIFETLSISKICFLIIGLLCFIYSCILFYKAKNSRKASCIPYHLTKSSFKQESKESFALAISFLIMGIIFLLLAWCF